MGYTTVFEIPENSYLWSELFFSAGIVLAAILYICACGYNIYKKNKLSYSEIFAVATLIFVGLVCSFRLYDFARDGIQDPDVKAYYAGEYEIAEGQIRDFHKTKNGYMFYIGDQWFSYEGKPLPDKGTVKVYYIDKGEDTVIVMRIDVKH